MNKKNRNLRLIPIVLIKNGLVVRSQDFKVHQSIGNPINTIRRFSNWGVDELIILDIGDEKGQDLRRDDLYTKYDSNNILDLIKKISEVTLMPLSVGGRIKNFDDAEQRFKIGADKIILNTTLVENPDLILQLVKRYGSQAIVASIDAKKIGSNYFAFIDGGKKKLNISPFVLAKKAESLGIGEILINSINKDGTGTGYDYKLINKISNSVKIPVIGCGGAGEYNHFSNCINNTNCDAVAAANFFHFYELSYPFAKKKLLEDGFNLPPVSLDNTQWFSREPNYKRSEIKKLINERIKKSTTDPSTWGYKKETIKMKYCKKCTVPSSSASPVEFNDKGICTGCQMSYKKFNITRKQWRVRKNKLVNLIKNSKNKDNEYDCLIPVSGGKDSYFQTHYIKNVLGFNPLLLTYYGNNYTKEDLRNLRNMKEVFNVDHIIYYPSINVLKKLNRIGFYLTGDMNLHQHLGIFTLPMQTAIKYKIPIVIWGEHGYSELSGQFSIMDFVEYTYRFKLEHCGRGYEWNSFLGFEGLTKKDLLPYIHPTDKEMYDLNLRGLHLSNYLPWEPNSQTKLVIKKYNFKPSNKTFERTYRKMSNLDDMHENGMHDYLKYIKFGYGRCTDHAAKDIRAGLMKREKAVKLVKKHDSIKSRDLKRWTLYTGITEKKFDQIADTFRDKRVWSYNNKKWTKDNLWD